MTILLEAKPYHERNGDPQAELRARDAARSDPALQEAVTAIKARAEETMLETQLQHQRDLVAFKLESKNKDLKIGIISLLGMFAMLSTVAGMLVYGEFQGQEKTVSRLHHDVTDLQRQLADAGREIETMKVQAVQLQTEVAKERSNAVAAVARAKAAEDAATAKATTGPAKPKPSSGKPWLVPAAPIFPVKADCHPQDPLCGDLGV